MGSWSRIYAIVAGVGLLVYSYLIKRNSALKSENDHLNKEIEGVKDNAITIVKIQHAQNEISSAPAPDRDELYKQLLTPGARNKKH
jgi:hypothetical protein